MKKIIFYLALVLLINCTKNMNAFKNVKRTSNPVISTLFNNRMLLLFKGTYATDNPLTFDEINGGTGFLYLDKTGGGFDPNIVQTGDGIDPYFDLNTLPKARDIAIEIDIGELRISSSKTKLNLESLQNSIDSKRFWDFIAPQRQVYCTAPGYTMFSNSCSNDGGIARMEEFFDGNGAKYPSNDPTSDTRFSGIISSGSQYYHAGVYIRNLVTGFSRENNAPIINTKFDNFDVTGSNTVPRNSYKPLASASDKAYYTPLMFPIFYTISNEYINGGAVNDDMVIKSGYEPYIIEMRINIKENLMVHSFVNPNTTAIRTMVGYSDWKYPHNGEIDMGGNILLRTRVIYPETSASIFITGGTQTLKHYYAIYGAFEKLVISNLPYAASPVRNGTTKIKYAEPGNYILYCLEDAIVDGYPDTIIRQIPFEVPKAVSRPQINLDLSCP